MQQLLEKFQNAVDKYELIKKGDRIGVCISGGKDSMLMALLFRELKKTYKIPFDIEYLVMDPGYNKENRAMIEKNAKKLNIPIKIYETTIFDSVFDIEKSPCYICARMRRGNLYSMARENGCNKIALGHHFDDVIETILMGMLYGAQVQTMMPKLHSTNFKGMELIRPMYLIREDEIIGWRDKNNLKFLRCACRFTEMTEGEDMEQSSKRKEIKALIKEIGNSVPEVAENIFNSVNDVDLNYILSYKGRGYESVPKD